jgi:uncharacterized OB-fold protein
MSAEGSGERAVSEPMTVAECVTCGYLAYPPRILCPNCGGGEWRDRPAGSGVVTEVTETREGVRVGAVRSDGGVRIIARLDPGISAGDPVELHRDGFAALARSGT